MFLLRNLKPERYARHALATLATSAAPAGETIEGNPGAALTDSLRALEPPLPAEAQALLDDETLDHELQIADIADGTLPDFLGEQRPVRPEPTREEAKLAQARRGEQIDRTVSNGRQLTEAEQADWFAYHEFLDPLPRSRKRYR